MSQAQENIQMDVADSSASPAPSNANTEAPASLTEIEVKDENTALNLIVSFLNLAQRRGAYKLEESSVFLRAINEFVVSK